MKVEKDKSLIRPLKKGDKVYNDLGLVNFIWYRYLCPMPLKNGDDCDSYHILVDCRTEQPIRMYYEDLNTILTKNLNSVEDITKLQIKLTEDHLDYLKKER